MLVFLLTIHTQAAKIVFILGWNLYKADLEVKAFPLLSASGLAWTERTGSHWPCLYVGEVHEHNWVSALTSNSRCGVPLLHHSSPIPFHTYGNTRSSTNQMQAQHIYQSAIALFNFTLCNVLPWSLDIFCSKFSRTHPSTTPFAFLFGECLWATNVMATSRWKHQGLWLLWFLGIKIFF